MADSAPMEGVATSATYQPQEEPAKTEPPPLPEYHVCITYTKEQLDYATQLKVALEENKFKVKMADDDVYLGVAEMKDCLKVIMFISSQFLEHQKYKEEISCVEQLTTERCHEILIPVLCGLTYEQLPPRLQEGSALPHLSVTKDYPIAGEQNYWRSIVDGIDKVSPILSTVTNGVGFGLAWGHFFGYLQFILTDLSMRIQAADRSDWDIQANATLCNKMVAIFPYKGRLARSLADYDPEITSVTLKSSGEKVKVKHTIDFPGHPKKDFSCGMFKATVNLTQYVFFAEVPATLNTLAKMRDSNFVTFTEEQFQTELARVKASLENVLRTHKDEHQRSRLESVAFVDFDDRSLSEESSRGMLSGEIARVINNRRYLEQPDP